MSMWLWHVYNKNLLITPSERPFLSTWLLEDDLVQFPYSSVCGSFQNFPTQLHTVQTLCGEILPWILRALNEVILYFWVFLWLSKMELSFTAVQATVCLLLLTFCWWSSASTNPSWLLNRTQSESSGWFGNKGSTWENNCSQISYHCGSMWLSGNASLWL